MPSDSGDQPTHPASRPDAELATRPSLARGANGVDHARVGASGIPDSGLYAVLGVSPAVGDADIQVAYRRKAAQLARSRGRGGRELRQLNAAYEVLGNPTRRAEYDSAMRLTTPVVAPSRATTVDQPIRPAPAPAAPRHRTGRLAPTSNGGLPDIVAVLLLVGVAAAAAAFVIPRIPVNLSALNALGNVLSIGPSPRRIVLDTPASLVPTAAPAAAPTATAAPTPPPAGSPTDHFAGSTVTVSSTSPAQFSQENVVVTLKRDGGPAPDVDVWSSVQYRTAEERWPATGTVKTDANGSATIAFNVGQATAGYPVQVRVYAQVDGQQLSWSTTFTPH